MPVADLREARDVHGALDALFTAPEGATDARLRDLFIGRLDFARENGIIVLNDPQLPASATRIAGRDGVHVVALRLPEGGRVSATKVRLALKRIGDQLGGETLLAATDADRSQWHFVYPTTKAGRETLRRMVIHRGQPYRTVAEQLSKIYQEAEATGLQRALENAYNVEAVTKRFFATYKAIFARVSDAMRRSLPDDEERKRFCQVLFNRLMFLYFLQRKGWLTFDGDQQYFEALWRAGKGDKNFYDSRLKLLFFTALSNERSTNFNKVNPIWKDQIGVVPFLNGGLFEESDLDKRAGVVVPNAAIEAILTELFAPFNFTIAESTPYDVQVAVDPEMLGKVFEELVTGRHESGAYYTPRPIVAFMCREALKGHLTTAVPGLTADLASAFVDEHQVAGITVAQAGKILDALETITAVDPACGSGAYLLGMMQELIDLQRLLYSSDLIQGDKELYDLKLRIIERNLYGVDIDPVAVNIAMLRLWLSLIIDYNAPGDPPALPNLAFKIRCGDSLLAPEPQSTLLPNLFRDRAHKAARELAKLKGEYLRETGEAKRQRGEQIAAVEANLKQLFSFASAPPGSVDWRIAFSEVFDERGGFDVVLANPPYVRQELIKEIKPDLKREYGALYSGTTDLYVYFYYRALQLLRDGGMLTFISSNKWFRAGYGAKLRGYMAKHTAVSSITDFGDLPVFETAIAYPMIFITQKAGTPRATHYTQVKSLAAPYPDVRAVIEGAGQELPTGAIGGETWNLIATASADRFASMRASSTSLGEYVNGQIYYGIKTGLNKAFFIDGKKRDELIATDPKSAELIKPLVVGRDIRKWTAEYKDRWMIVTPIGVNMKRYPAIMAHLSQWKPELKKRQDQGEHWWELRACAYYAAFSQPKIIYPVMARQPSFLLDEMKGEVNSQMTKHLSYPRMTAIS